MKNVMKILMAAVVIANLTACDMNPGSLLGKPREDGYNYYYDNNGNPIYTPYVNRDQAPYCRVQKLKEDSWGRSKGAGCPEVPTMYDVILTFEERITDFKITTPKFIGPEANNVTISSFSFGA